jgi:hypothetical protein
MEVRGPIGFCGLIFYVGSPTFYMVYHKLIWPLTSVGDFTSYRGYIWTGGEGIPAGYRRSGSDAETQVKQGAPPLKPGESSTGADYAGQAGQVCLLLRALVTQSLSCLRAVEKLGKEGAGLPPWLRHLMVPYFLKHLSNTLLDHFSPLGLYIYKIFTYFFFYMW